eukprot:CFRG4962T1
MVAHTVTTWYRNSLCAFVVGLVISLSIAGTGAFSQALLQEIVEPLPVAQSLFTYVLLSVVYIPVLAYQKNLGPTIRNYGPSFLAIAFIDVQANFLIVQAYKYTSMSSVQILDCFTVPCVAFLSYCFLGTQFKFNHFVGACISCLGIVMLLLVDDGTSSSSSSPLYGGLLCLLGAVLYSITNVCQEHFVRTDSCVPYLAMLGLFGTLLSAVQVAMIELEGLKALVITEDVVLLTMGFSSCMFIVYSMIPIFVGMSSVTFLNMTLLLADIFSLCLGVLLFNTTFSLVYLASFGCIMVGIMVYILRPSNTLTLENNGFIFQLPSSRKMSETTPLL